MNRRLAKGFTIVEVLIVLAVAAVIMAVVFATVPQLQRSSRDQNRKSIASRIRGEIENYAANNGGTNPFVNIPVSCPLASATAAGDWADFYYVSLSKININDPSLGTPVINCTPSTTASATASYVAPWAASIALANSKGLLDIVIGAACNGTAVVSSTATNAYAVVIGLETANTRYCVDNS